MAIPVALQNFLTSTTLFTAPDATQLALPTAAITQLTNNLGVGDLIIVSVSDGVHQEFMEITGVTSGAADVTRGVEGTTATSLASGATVRFVWTITSLNDVFPGGSVTVVGADGTTVTGGPDYTVSSPVYTFTAGAGINITGTATAPIFASIAPAGATGPTGPTGPAVVVTGSGQAVATGGPTTYNIAVATPTVTAGTGIAVTGTWPNITVANTQTPGGSGTVTSVAAGTGINITGSPTVNPTIKLATVGPGAGPYGGITLNAYGQITAVSSGLVTSVTATAPLTASNTSTGVWNVAIPDASTSQKGVTQYAAATNAASNNASDATHSVTPAGIAAVLAAQSLSPATLTAYGTQTALSSATYTTAVSGFNIPVTVATGKSAIVDIYVEVYDTADATAVASFGIGLFNTATLLAGVSLIPSSLRRLQYLVTGPLTATLTVNTTALTGTFVVGSFGATVVAN